MHTWLLHYKKAEKSKIVLIQDLQNTNHRLQKVPIGVRALYWFPSLLAVLLVSSLAIRITVFCIFSLFIIFLTRLSIRQLLRLYRIPAVFILLGCLTLLFTWKSSHPLFSVGTLQIGLDDKSLFFVIQLLCQSMATISIIYFFMLTHTISEITLLMKSIKVPDIFTELFILSYKFIENLFDTYEQILISMQCRMAYCNKVQQWKNYTMLIGTVFQKSFNQVNKLEVSSLSRNIELFNKGLTQKQQYKAKQLILPGILCVALITFITLEYYVGL